MLLLFRET